MLMCMCMLTKRTNILFSEEDYHFLTTLATQKGTSLGKLIRKAVRKVYQANKEIPTKQQLVKSLQSLWKKQKGVINYKQFVENGRKI